MLSNYLKIAYRNLLKHKIFSLINIIGLSVGMTCCILLALYVKDEFSYEQHFTGHDRVYRLYTGFTKDGEKNTFPRVSPPIAPALPNLLPEVEIATRVITPPEVEQHLIRYGEALHYEKRGYLVDSTFFDVFDYDFAEGDRHTVLDQPATVVLSSKTARKIFGEKSPLDEQLIINSGPSIDTFRITGVLKPYRNPSHLDADFYMSLRSEGWGDYISSVTTWAWQNFANGYVKLRPLTHAREVEAKIPQLMDKYAGADLKASGLIKEIHLQPLDDIRLYSDFKDNFNLGGSSGSITYVYILSTIGIFILILACINFMNLTTAKASQRTGEVGVRKSLGATRGNLVKQFLGESMTIVVISALVAIAAAKLTLPFFNQLTNKALSLEGSNLLFVTGIGLLITLLTGTLAGSYPAFFLSAFEPARILKGKQMAGGSQWVRKGLVVSQFIISITLISTIVIIHQQFEFIQNKSLGFDPTRNMVIPLRTQEARTQYLNLRDRVSQLAGVEAVSATTSLPSTPLLRDYALYVEGSSMEKGVLHRMINVDERYLDLLDMKLIAGRHFIFQTDSFSNVHPRNRVIVNEASLREYGIPLEDAVGTQLLSEFSGDIMYHEIIGVVEDFHQQSLHERIPPIMFRIPSQRDGFIFMTMKLKGNDYSSVSSQVEHIWKELVPSTPFENQLLADSIKLQYEKDQRVSRVITISTILAMLISCLGLYGLSIFMAERRTKEIGIRKVLGASVPGIIAMLSTDFLKLILLAFAIAAPIGYYAMEQWLESFVYRMDLSVLIFVVSGVITFLIAWLTIGFESVRAALSNPVKSLRSE